MSKKSIAIELSKLKVFENPKEKEEQYSTDSELASELLWNAFMLGDIKEKTVADFGAGTGILGIGALLLGAKKAYFVERDKKVIAILRENLIKIKKDYDVIEGDVADFNIKVDTVIMNPPFGTRKRNADREFLIKAFDIANTVYSIHLKGSENFLEKLAYDEGKSVTNVWDGGLQLKKTMKHHKRNVHRAKVVMVRIE